MKVKSFKPWADRILVMPKEREKKTEGGIIIADTVTVEAELGEVMGVGEAIEGVEVGAVVIYPTGAGWSLQVGEKMMRVIKKEQIEGEVS